MLQTVCVVMQQHFQSCCFFDLKFRLSCDELLVIVFFNQSEFKHHLMVFLNGYSAVFYSSHSYSL